MRVTFILSLFREDIVRALFWTLAHSLWQGLALAMLTGVVILLTRRANPALRYNILLGLFSLFLAAAGTTFFLELHGTAHVSDGQALTPGIGSPLDDTPVLSNLFTMNEQPWTEKLTGYLNQKAGLIVAVWVVILFVRLLKLLVNLGTVQRLRYYRSSVADEYWRQRIKELAQRIGIKKAVVLLESAIIRVPMMAGVFKPVILVPLGLLSQLPPQQVEAILLHELAHIRRKDYFVNLLQSIAETLFFFNPAVLWISSLIREERENCCDDIAVGETRSKKEFIHALVSFQEYKQSASYAMAFPGSKNHLLERVKRIVHNDNKTLNIREKFFLLICVFITAGLTMAYARQTPDTARPARQLMEKVKFVTDAMARDTAKPKVIMDTAIPQDMGRQREQMAQQQDALIQQKKRLEEAEQRLLMQEKELADQQERLNQLYADAMSRVQELRDSVHGRGSLGQLQEKQEQFEALNMKKRLLETQLRQQDADMRLKKFKIVEDDMQQQRQILRKLEGLRRKEVNTLYLQERSTGRKNKYIAPIIELLQDKKLISQTDELSFSLDKDELIVNGQRQPEEVFKTFKELFLEDPQDYVKYSKKGETESTSVSRHKN